MELKLKREWVRNSDHIANDGEYKYYIETENGWIALTDEQSKALEELRNGAYGNPLLNGKKMNKE